MVVVGGGWMVVVVVVLTSIYAVAGRESVNNNKRKGTWVTHLYMVYGIWFGKSMYTLASVLVSYYFSYKDHAK